MDDHTHMPLHPGLPYHEAAPFTNSQRIVASVPDLSGDEQNVLRRLVGRHELDVNSSNFMGTAWGAVPGVPEASRQIDFVFDQTNGRIRFWYEQ